MKNHPNRHHGPFRPTTRHDRKLRHDATHWNHTPDKAYCRKEMQRDEE